MYTKTFWASLSISSPLLDIWLDLTADFRHTIPICRACPVSLVSFVHTENFLNTFHRAELPMFSILSASTIDFLLSSTAMAFSNAIRLTILLHSWYLALASLSLGFTFVTWKKTQHFHIKLWINLRWLARPRQNGTIREILWVVNPYSNAHQ